MLVCDYVNSFILKEFFIFFRKITTCFFFSKQPEIKKASKSMMIFEVLATFLKIKNIKHYSTKYCTEYFVLKVIVRI